MKFKDHNLARIDGFKNKKGMVVIVKSRQNIKYIK